MMLIIWNSHGYHWRDGKDHQLCLHNLLSPVFACFDGLLLLVADRVERWKKIPDINYSHDFSINCSGTGYPARLSNSIPPLPPAFLSSFDQRFAVKYSFIMSIPAVLGAAVLELKDIGSETISGGLVTNCRGRYSYVS